MHNTRRMVINNVLCPGWNELLDMALFYNNNYYWLICVIKFDFGCYQGKVQ